MMSTDEKTIPKQAVKPCWVTAALTLVIVLIAVLTILAALALTIFRPRDPTITIDLAGLRSVGLRDLLSAQNVTTRVVIGLSNENYASFAWRNFTASIRLNGTSVGEVTIPEGRVLQRAANMNITAAPTLQLDKLLLPPFNLSSTVAALEHGGLTFTCSATVFGEVRAFDVLPRVRGSASVYCVGSMYVSSVYSAQQVGVFGGQAWCWTAKKQLHLRGLPVIRV